jgi:hypothetical protein
MVGPTWAPRVILTHLFFLPSPISSSPLSSHGHGAAGDDDLKKTPPARPPAAAPLRPVGFAPPSTRPPPARRRPAGFAPLRARRRRRGGCGVLRLALPPAESQPYMDGSSTPPAAAAEEEEEETTAACCAGGREGRGGRRAGCRRVAAARGRELDAAPRRRRRVRRLTLRLCSCGAGASANAVAEAAASWSGEAWVRRPVAGEGKRKLASRLPPSCSCTRAGTRRHTLLTTRLAPSAWLRRPAGIGRRHSARRCPTQTRRLRAAVRLPPLPTHTRSPPQRRRSVG